MKLTINYEHSFNRGMTRSSRTKHKITPLVEEQLNFTIKRCNAPLTEATMKKVTNQNHSQNGGTKQTMKLTVVLS